MSDNVDEIVLFLMTVGGGRKREAKPLPEVATDSLKVPIVNFYF